jgi:hypothetical protein
VTYTVEHSDFDAAVAASTWDGAEPGTYDAIRDYATEHEDRHLPHMDDVAVTR